MSEQVEEKNESNSFFGNESDQNKEDDLEETETQENENDDEIIEIPRSELERLEEERDEFEQKFMRKTADLDNLRKRKEKEKEDLKKYGNSEVLTDVIEVIDNFERALESLEIESADVREGVEMIKNQLDQLLDKYNVEPIEADDTKFDPHKHEGMMREERDDLDEKRVIEVFKQGYELYDRVLRPASVKVGVPTNTNEIDTNASDEESNENEN